MKNCEQTAGMSVLQHGHKVWEKFEQLSSFKPDKLLDFRLPKWYTDNVDLLRTEFKKYHLRDL
jgi:hypothetical protein